jgi:hypothetical protein
MTKGLKVKGEKLKVGVQKPSTFNLQLSINFIHCKLLLSFWEVR